MVLRGKTKETSLVEKKKRREGGRFGCFRPKNGGKKKEKRSANTEKKNQQKVVGGLKWEKQERISWL